MKYLLTSLNKLKTVSFILFLLLLTLAVLFYNNYRAKEIQALPNSSRKDVHAVNGKPCGTAYYKCCGIEMGDKMATYYDVWESFILIGSNRTSVYYNAEDKVVTKENKFQWTFEPTLKSLGRDKGSCLQFML